MNSTLKKTANILGIIAAWILSIALVFALIVSPLLLSMLSLMNPDAIMDSVKDVLTQTITPTEDSASADFGVSQLSAVKAPHEDDVRDAAGEAGGSILEGILGDEASPEMIQQILDSDIAKEFVKMYTDGIVNAFTNGASGKRFDETVVKDFVSENIDEIAELAQQLMPELSQEDQQQLKDSILSAVNENAEEFFDALPKPEELKEQVMENNPDLAVLFQIFAKRKMIKAVIVGALVLLSGLIFLCRLPGLRGFRWLATDLFIGSGFCVLQSAGFLLGSSAIKAMLASQPALAGTVGKLISSFTTGMLIRTVIMLLAAVALLVAYMLIKKAQAKKQLASAQAEQGAECAEPEATETGGAMSENG